MMMMMTVLSTVTCFGLAPCVSSWQREPHGAACGDVGVLCIGVSRSYCVCSRKQRLCVCTVSVPQTIYSGDWATGGPRVFSNTTDLRSLTGMKGLLLEIL
jgi:hypothetical protein